MRVNFYSYRVEFQMRGAGHIHGVLWLDLPSLEKEFPGLVDILKNIKNQVGLTSDQKNMLARFVDSHVSCSLENESEDLNTLVREVQSHKHTKTCKKGRYGTLLCRFGYSKCPSDRTIIAVPLDKSEFVSDDEYKKKQKELEVRISAVKDVLNDFETVFEGKEENAVTISDVLEKAKLTQEEYYEALSVSRNGISIVLKRTPAERNINNYNPFWLTAWKANMDLQPCIDFFAVITYITDYYSKDESGTTPHLVEAVKAFKGESNKEKMRVLAQTFLTHRQMGKFEAYYRILPHLRLTESNVSCLFVSTGFPEKRSQFLKKVNDDGPTMEEDVPNVDEDEPQVDEDGIEPPMEKQLNFIKVPNNKNKYVLQQSIHDKYSIRPNELEAMCFAQFCMLYETISKSLIKNKDFMGDASVELDEDRKIVSPNPDERKALPKYIRIISQDPQDSRGPAYMKLRQKHPLILRYKKYCEETDAHQFYYSQTLLFIPWRNEIEELFPGDTEIDKCYAKFQTIANQGSTELLVSWMKRTLFPEAKNIEEARSFVESLPEADQRPGHIGDILDPSNVQENEDDADEGVSESPDQQIRSYDPPNQEFSSDNAIYQKINTSQERLLMARQLVPEQRYVFDHIIGYCKEVRKSQSNGTAKPKAPLMVIQGGAGSGKSKLINDISTHAHKILMTDDNRNIEHPLVIKLAPTGKAASNINGLTMHTGLKFPFAGEYIPLGDEPRDSLRTLLGSLRIVIVDEMSMVRSDHLYFLDLRLKEIKQCEQDFGGVAVLLFGDLMQLQPVNGYWIFETPQSEKFLMSHTLYPLWQQFQPFVLKENHRQGEDRVFGDLLNRLRLGWKGSENKKEEDLNILRSRVISNFPQGVPDGAFHIYGKKIPVREANDRVLNSMSGPLISIQAIYSSRLRPKVDPKDGTIGSSGFLETLHLKKGARVMMTVNVDTADGLTNGSIGTVGEFVFEEGQVKYIMVKFEEPANAGQRMRDKHHSLKAKYPDLTVVKRTSWNSSLGDPKRKHAQKSTFVQFPLTLAWALTSHKVQGMTVKYPKAVASDLDTSFADNQVYVILGRAQRLEQLYLAPFKKKIRTSRKSLAENERLEQEFMGRLAMDPWQKTKNGTLRICILNILSLPQHIQDLRSDSKVLKSDIIVLTETWLEEGQRPPVLDGFKSFFCDGGRGKGVVIYVKTEHIAHQSIVYGRIEDGQVVKLMLKDFKVIGVYRSPSSTNVLNLLSVLREDLESDMPTIICGDFNVHWPLPHQDPQDSTIEYRRLEYAMTDSEFKQWIDKATHRAGNILDHLFIRGIDLVHTSLHHVYYSDHDAICAIVKTPSHNQ